MSSHEGFSQFQINLQLHVRDGLERFNKNIFFIITPQNKLVDKKQFAATGIVLELNFSK